MNNISPKSSLSYILLIKEYKMLDIDHIKEREIKSEIIKGNFINIGIRKAFFAKVKRKYGMLKCQVCNTNNLIEKAVGKEKKSPNMATIEHVIPISEGGLKYIETNFICTCNKCNNERGSKPIYHIGNDMYIF